MAYSDSFVIIPGVLGDAVANGATFTVSYPTGASLASFDSGLVGTGHYILLDDNDKYGFDDIAVSFGATDITITNNSGVTWAGGSTVEVSLAQVPRGRNIVFLTFYMTMQIFTAPGPMYSDIRLGGGAVIEDVRWLILYTPAVAADRALTIALDIDGTRVTGGELLLTSANCVGRGGVVAGTPITARNVLTRESALSILATASTGSALYSVGTLMIRVRLTDD